MGLGYQCATASSVKDEGLAPRVGNSISEAY